LTRLQLFFGCVSVVSNCKECEEGDRRMPSSKFRPTTKTEEKTRMFYSGSKSLCDRDSARITNQH